MLLARVKNLPSENTLHNSCRKSLEEATMSTTHEVLFLQEPLHDGRELSIEARAHLIAVGRLLSLQMRARKESIGHIGISNNSVSRDCAKLFEKGFGDEPRSMQMASYFGDFFRNATHLSTASRDAIIRLAQNGGSAPPTSKSVKIVLRQNPRLLSEVIPYIHEYATHLLSIAKVLDHRSEEVGAEASGTSLVGIIFVSDLNLAELAISRLEGKRSTDLPTHALDLRLKPTRGLRITVKVSDQIEGACFATSQINFPELEGKNKS